MSQFALQVIELSLEGCVDKLIVPVKHIESSFIEDQHVDRRHLVADLHHVETFDFPWLLFCLISSDNIIVVKRDIASVSLCSSEVWHIWGILRAILGRDCLTWFQSIAFLDEHTHYFLPQKQGGCLFLKIDFDGVFDYFKVFNEFLIKEQCISPSPCWWLPRWLTCPQSFPPSLLISSFQFRLFSICSECSRNLNSFIRRVGFRIDFKRCCVVIPVGFYHGLV